MNPSEQKRLAIEDDIKNGQAEVPVEEPKAKKPHK